MTIVFEYNLHTDSKLHHRRDAYVVSHRQWTTLWSQAHWPLIAFCNYPLMISVRSTS